VRTRIYLTSAEVFGDVRRVCTMVVVIGFLDPRWKVEIEAEAQL
jgi:hypothetical protein